jgi:sarcosine oxidase
VKVAIVGAGVMGCASARALARRGHHVTIYEQFSVGHRRGSSHGRTRIYRYSYADESYVGMMKEAVALWHELEGESGELILQKTGGLDMGKDLDAHVAAFEAHDISYEVIDAKAVAQRWPSLSLPEGDVLFQADGGVVHAEKAWHAFVSAALTAGTTLLEERRIDDLGPHGFIDYDVTVVTAGGWAKQLLATAGIDLDVKPTRETIAYFRLDDVPPTLVDWGDPSVYALHDPGHGLKAGEHIAGPETDPDGDGAPNVASVERLTEWVRARFRAADPQPVGAETCIYTNTPDEHFELARHGSIVVGSACSGHGFKFAPLIGKRIADLVEQF